MSNKHSDKQIGGEHYKHMKIQVTEFVATNGIPFIEGNVIKYVQTRPQEWEGRRSKSNPLSQPTTRIPLQ